MAKTKYGSKGKFKYRCLDCGETTYIPLVHFARSCRPRCPGCGSYALDTVTRDAKQRRGLQAQMQSAEKLERRERMNPTESQ